MPVSNPILEELKSGPIKWIASILSIIVAIIIISQYVGPHNTPPLMNYLISDKQSPQYAGATVTWAAKANDPENDTIQYKFFLNGNSVTDWSPQTFWIWTNTKANVGKNHVEVCIRDGRHANQDNYDSFKVADFLIIDVNQAPVMNSLTSNLPSPQYSGSTIIWTALASDSDRDIKQYRFFLDSQPKTDWSDNPIWAWPTSAADIGTHVVEVKVKDNKHELIGDDSRAANLLLLLRQAGLSQRELPII